MMLMHLTENGNRYEGEWKEGNKHGPGRFFYVNKALLVLLFMKLICGVGSGIRRHLGRGNSQVW